MLNTQWLVHKSWDELIVMVVITEGNTYYCILYLLLCLVQVENDPFFVVPTFLL